MRIHAREPADADEHDLPGQVGVYAGVMYSEYQLFGAEASARETHGLCRQRGQHRQSRVICRSICMAPA